MLSGSHHELSLSDLIQIGSANRRTLRARVRGAARGEVYLEHGELRHATYGDLVGCEAIYAMLGEEVVSYEVEADVVASEASVFAPVAHVLLEAARRLDEGSVRTPALRPATRATTAPGARSPARGWLVLALGAAAVFVLAAITVVAAGQRDPVAASGSGSGSGSGSSSGSSSGTVLPPVLQTPLHPTAPAVDVALRPTVVVRARVDADGLVTDAAIYRSRLELAAFEDVALDAVRAATFDPARAGGRAVAAWINVPVTFADPPPPMHLSMKGSDTIGGALGPALAAAFHAERPDVDVSVEALGSATAFVGLLDGTADLGASSRPVDDAELARAHDLGVSFQETVIGYDGIAVIVHPDSPLHALTVGQVAQLFTGEVARWSELGGPDRPVHLYGRPDYSGTHQFFHDKVLGGAEFAPAVTAIEDNARLVAAVAADPDAIAYVGSGWVTGDVRALALAPGSSAAPVAPSAATILDGTYPIYRALLVYTRGAPAGAAAAFLRFVLSADGQAVVAQHGFVPTDLTADDVIPASAERAAPTPAPAPALHVPFRPGAAWLSHAAARDLDVLAHRALADGARVLVIGHADAEGARADNDAIAARRATTVATHLLHAGVPADRIAIDSAGDAAPLASNGTAAGRTANRRADVYLLH